MNSLVIASLALIVAIPLVLLWLFRGRRKTSKCVYQTNPMLFSPEERTLYASLREAVGDEFEILGKIRVGDIIQPRRGTPELMATSGYQDVAERCFSFVLCNKSDLSVVCAVELREHAHGSRRAAEPDGLLQALCAAAGLPLAPIRTGPFYDINELRVAIADAMKKAPPSLPHGDGRKEPHISSIEGLDLE